MKAAIYVAVLALACIAMDAHGQADRRLPWKIIQQEIVMLRDKAYAGRVTFDSAGTLPVPRVDGVAFHFGEAVSGAVTLGEVIVAPVDEVDGIGVRRVEQLCGDALIHAMTDLGAQAKKLGANAVVAVRSDQPSDGAGPSGDRYLCRETILRTTSGRRESGPVHRAQVRLRGTAVRLGV